MWFLLKLSAGFVYLLYLVALTAVAAGSPHTVGATLVTFVIMALGPALVIVIIGAGFGRLFRARRPHAP